MVKSRSDASCEAVAAGDELACVNGTALDGECATHRHIDAGILVIEPGHFIRRSVLQDDGGVALAGDSCP